MRPFRPARVLAIPALVVPLVLCTLAASGPAFAKGVSGNKTVSCRTLLGTAGGSWNLAGCNNTAITGVGGNPESITPSFPTAVTSDYVATITWGTGSHRGPNPTTNTITVSVSIAPRDRCASGSTEWELIGSVTGHTPATGATVKGKVKIFACVTRAGVVSNNLGRKGSLKAVRL